MVWQQYRRVDAGSMSVENLDMDIEVENTGDSEHRFDVTIWNLTDETWEKVSEDDYCRIALGWEDGVVQNVMHGLVEKKKTEIDGNDMKFRLKGTEVSDHQKRKRLSKTYGTNQSPSQIATDIAGQIGLTAGSIDTVNATVDSNFIVSKDKPARHWLDKLVTEAQNLTEYGWEWFIDGGRLYFVKKNGREEEAVELSYDNTLLSLNSIDSESEEEKGLEFEAMMEPRIRMGGAIAVNTDDYKDGYKVSEYVFKSNTNNGDHKVTGKLDPLGASYV